MVVTVVCTCSSLSLELTCCRHRMQLIVLSASANKLAKLKEQAEEYASLIMEELDPENLGYIEVILRYWRCTPRMYSTPLLCLFFRADTCAVSLLARQLWQLEALLLQRDTYMTYSRPLSTASGAQWSQNLGGTLAVATGGGDGGDHAVVQEQRRRWGVRKAAARVRVAAEENWRGAWVLALWFAAMAALFVWKFVQYRRMAAFQVMGYCLPTAKGAAETLKLNMALVLLPVCRNTLTWLRSSWARFFVPFDDNITFHKVPRPLWSSCLLNKYRRVPR
jgi:respiratory burst oxidase